MTTFGSLLELGQTIWGGTDKIIAFLRRNRLLASSKQCSRLPPYIPIELQYTLVCTGVMCQCKSAAVKMSVMVLVGTVHDVTPESQFVMGALCKVKA